MRKLFIYGSLISGAVAAIMMYKRGESLGTIAKKVTTSPVSSMVSELKAA